MPSNFGSTPTSTTVLGTNSFPVSAGFVPNTASGNLTSIQLGPSSTDTNGYTSAPVAVYIADGSSLTDGATTDAAVTGDVAGSISAKLRGLNKIFAQLQFDGSNFLKVNVAAGTVSASQSGTWNINNISGTVSLPTGAATSSKQPALGTAGSASTDVLTIQGIASMTPLAVSGTFWQATQPVSGTITANAGTGNFTVVQATGTNLHAVLDSGSTTAVTQATASNLNAQIVGSVASGASNAGNPVKVSGVYNSTQPTVTTGQIVDVQATARGAQIVATGVDAFAVNASQSGTWNINNISGTISLPTGAATSAKQPALGTAGSASTDVLTVQGIASMTALKVDGSAVTQPISGTVTANIGTSGSLALDTSVNGILLSQGSTTSGQKGSLVQGAVTTNAPTYVTAQTSPLSLDTTGLLRVSIKDTPSNTNNLNVALAAASATVTVSASGNFNNASIGSTGSAVPASASYLGANKSGNLTGLSLDGSGNLNVNVAAGSSGNAAAAATGSAVPASADYGGINVAGTLRGQTGVNPSGSIYAGQMDLASVAGTTADTNSGNKSAGTLRVVIATDQPQLTNSLKVDGSGVTQPVSGTVTANAGTGTFNIQQSNITTDYDTGAGAQTMTMFGVALPASGGAVAGGTSSNPLRIDPTGSTTQPVSGTVTANAGSGTFTIQSNASVNVNQIAGSSVATAATGIMKVGLTDGSGTAITSTSNAIDVNIKSGGGSGFSVVDEAAWTAGTSAFVPAGGVFNDSAAALTSGQQGSIRLTNNRAIHVNLRDASANQLLGSKNSAGSIPVVIASDQGAVPVSQSGTWTVQPGNTQNSTAWLTQDAADGPVSAGTAASKSILGGVVYNTSAPAPTNGQQVAMQADQAGNIRIFPGVALTTLAAWNSSTGSNATQTIFTNSGASAVLIQLDQTTTITGGAITFEANYDGSNWVSPPANCVLDPTSATYAQIANPYTLQASTNKPFLICNNGWQQLRIRLSTVISGTGAVTPYYALLAFNPVEQSIVYSPTAANFQVTANAGTNLNTSLLALESGGNLATLAGGVTSSKYQANVAQINGVAPTMGNGVSGTGVQRVTIASDSTGQVTLATGANTIGALTANQTVNIAQVAGGNASNAGQTGAMQVGGAVATNTVVSSATNPLLIAGSDYAGTPRVQSLKVDSSGNAQVAVTNTPTVTANIGTSGSLALDATVAKLNVAQAASLGSNTGPMVQGSVTTNAPTYVTGNINPLSLDTAGLLRVSIKDTPANTNNLNVNLAASAATVTVSATNLQTNLNQIAGSAISTAASGIQKVGVVGNSGATVDSTIGAGSAPTNAIVTGSVYNTSAPAPTNGQAMALQADQAGNIRTFPGIALAALSAWNSGTSLNATQNIFTNSGAAAVLVQLTQTTTLTAGAITFEVSYDNSNWSTIPASCVLDPTSTTFAQISLPYTVQASTNKSFLLNMNGAQGLRIKLSTQITGSGSVTPNYALLPLSPADTVIALSPTASNFNVSAAQSGTWNINNVSGTVSLPTGAATAAKQPALGTAGSASSDVLTVQGIASMTALKVDGSAVTQPVSGTVTANIGTSGSLALDTSVNGILLSQGSTTSGQKGSLIQGAVTTNAPSYSTAQTSPLSLDTSGLLRASLKDTPSNTNNLNVNLAASAATVTVSGTVTANQGGSNWSTNVAQIGGTNVVTGGASGLLAVGGPVASGASNADNPVKAGGVFNTTQPTVTNGQIVDAQYTARGAAIVATGTDTFTVTSNAGTNLNTSLLALESGGNLATLAGGVSSSKYQANIAQINGVAPTMGNGVSGTGVQRVTIASDSTGQVTLASGANTIGAVTQASGPWTSNITQIAGSSISTAATGVQKVGVVGNAGATVDSTVAAGSAPTNAIVTGAVYNTSAPAPTNGQAMALQADQAGNMRTFPGIALAILSAWNSSTGLNATQNIFTNSGAEAVLVQLTQTTTLSAGAVTFEVSYDGSTWLTIPASAVLDPTSTTFAQISLPYTVQASTNKQFLLNMNGAQGLRVKLSTQITGSGTVTPNYALLPASPADTVIALSPTAANFLVTATQSGTWANNVTQFGGNNVATGTGASGTGIPRVTVSNDSQLQIWDGTNGPVTVKAANTPATLTDKSIVQTLSPNNTGLPVNTPAIVQKAVNKSSGSVASLAQAFSSNNTAGNSIIVVCGVGNGTAPTISDTNSNTYTQAVQIANSTTLNVAIFYAVGIATGANTVTVNNGGTTASIAMEIYEVSGLIAQVRAQPDQTASNTGSSGTASTSTISALAPNEYAFAGVGIGTAAQNITAGSGWTNDSGQQNPTTPAGLFSFVSMSQYLGSLASVTPQATFTSEPWGIAVATFRPVLLGVEGTAKITDGTVTMSFGSKTSANSMPVVVASDQGAIAVSQSGTWTVQPGNTANSTAWLVQDVAGTSGGATTYHLVSASGTNANNVKNAAGLLYGYSISNTNAAARYVHFYNTSSSPTVGTTTPVATVQVPGNGTVIRAFPVGATYGTGISIGASTGAADNDSGSVGSGDLVIDLEYK